MAEKMDFLQIDREEDRPAVRVHGAWTIDHPRR
jgi:hypothetical protein